MLRLKVKLFLVCVYCEIVFLLLLYKLMVSCVSRYDTLWLNVCTITVFDQLIVAATITFSKENPYNYYAKAATLQGWLLWACVAATSLSKLLFPGLKQFCLGFASIINA